MVDGLGVGDAGVGGGWGMGWGWMVGGVLGARVLGWGGEGVAA